MDTFVGVLLNMINETLTATIVVVTASLLLYNLSRNLRNRVARTSGVVLACVTGVSVCDVLIALGPTKGTLEALVRLQWIGIAFLPAATFHLSDALLATTGLPSRGRRRRVARLLYLLSTVFVVAAAFTDILIRPIALGNQLLNIKGGILFPVYVAFLAVAVSVAFANVQRARHRCLTRDTRRRMGYLLFAMLTPALGIFPYSILFGLNETGSVGMLLLVNVANLVLILMLLFLSYPLSFFGSRLPDRVVKTDLLWFMLHGPATALLALAVIIFLTPATRIFTLPGTSFMPFAVVAVVLFWQWLVALVLPWLEKRLIYPNEDDDQLTRLQNLSDRLLTRSDLLQLLDAILASLCDSLQISTAFVAGFSGDRPELIASVGPARPNPIWLEDEFGTIRQILSAGPTTGRPLISPWQSYWIAPLFSRRGSDSTDPRLIIGFIGVQSRSGEIELTEDELHDFHHHRARAAQTLHDMRVQTEMLSSLEGLLPQISLTRSRAAEVEFLPGYAAPAAVEASTDEREQFVEQVRAALRHYWGGPGLSSSRLLELNVVQEALPENDNSPARALRAILNRAIEHQRPEGERKMHSPEWIIYNILEQRFIERSKVRDVAIRLALSEPDLYRKQRIAIEAVANSLMDMERAPNRG